MKNTFVLLLAAVTFYGCQRDVAVEAFNQISSTTRTGNSDVTDYMMA
jgi:hypothetical protein